MPKDYKQLSFTCSQEYHTKELEELIYNNGALSLTFIDAKDDPLYEPELGTTPLWGLTKALVLFNDDYDFKQLWLGLIKILPIDVIQSLEVEEISHQDWERVWLKYFKPISFADKLWIIPDGFEVIDQHAVNLYLDPGLAFGTGTHETTALCLEWLATHDLSDKTVMDYGCGSGILAVAAAKLDAKNVLATDIDSQAIIATKANAIKNDAYVDAFIANTGNSFKCDIVIANILLAPLKELRDYFYSTMKNNDVIVVSGVLSTQCDELINHYQGKFELIKKTSKNKWALMSFKKLQP